MSAMNANNTLSTANIKRSPTQRHMHNYSLPSPLCAPPPTTHGPTRCRSSPALSEFRQAVYIPGPCNFHGAEEASPQDDDIVVAEPHRSCDPAYTTGAAQLGRTRTGSPEPGLNPVLHSSPTAAHSLPSTPSIRQRGRESHFSPFSSVSPPYPASSSRPSTSPSRALTAKLNRLSSISITSLPFPLPTPPGLGSDAEWEIDPFAAAPYSSSTRLPSSRWSSSTSSLAHQPKPSEAVSKKIRSAPEKSKSDKPSPTKLKEFLGRLSINRSPTASGLHFRSQNAVVRELRRPDTMMTFDDELFFISEEENRGSLVEKDINRGDGKSLPCYLCINANIVGSTAQPRPAAKQDVCSVDASTLEPGVMNSNDQVEASTVSATSPTSTDTSSMSSQALIRKYRDGDGIAVSQDKSINASSVENPVYGCLRAPHVAASFLSPTMRGPFSDGLQSSSNSPGVNYSLHKPLSNQSHTFAIPPSPPHPPNSLPPSNSDSFLYRDFPLPPALAEHLPLPLAAGGTAAGTQNTPPPVIPPRSKLRPPPVKIARPSRQAYLTQIGVSDECCESSLNGASSTSLRSRSSIASFRTISPLPTPPIHSRSSSIASFVQSPYPTLPQHSHSASLASSDFIISPMPTPPPLSPSEFSPLSAPWARPVTPEPRIDIDVLRALLSQNNGRQSSACESEVGMSLEAIARAHESSDDSSTCRTTIPEFASQEEPRAPPSRMSFYDSECIHAPSDIDDDGTYSQFSSAYYTFRRRSSNTRRKRLFHRTGSKGKRATRRRTPVSMISVYSQASFCSQDASSVSTVSSLIDESSLPGDENLAENDLGDMVFEAPEYAYAFSWDDYVGYGLEGSALAGRSPTRSGADFEAELSRSPSRPDRRRNPVTRCEIRRDVETALTAQDMGKFKRRTSSNISVVENAVPIIEEPMVTVVARPALTDVSSLATNESISDISTTSTLPVSRSQSALLPNRRKRTIRSRVGTTAPSNHQPSSLTFVGDAKNEGSRRETSAVHVLSPPVKPKDTTVQSGSALRGMKKRVSVFKSLVSFTLALPRSPSSPTFPSGPLHKRSDHRPPLRPPPDSHQRALLLSHSVSSSPGGSVDTTSPPSSASSPWNPGLTNGRTLFLSPTATPSTFAI
ncbi:hypothetical protein C8R45DRAFT_1085786 [Mycena sanguinolenta]|nr:hypothetical protein C8R45DRAFT_1085786 [Mycena sanguinolenta]